HAFIDIHTWTDEQFAALLQVPQCICSGHSGTVSNQRARDAVRDFALPFRIAVKERIHHDCAARICKQLAAQADQTSAGNAEFNAHASVPVVVHVDDFALACSELLHDYAYKFVRNIYSEVLDRLHQFSIDAFGYNLRLADH